MTVEALRLGRVAHEGLINKRGDAAAAQRTTEQECRHASHIGWFLTPFMVTLALCLQGCDSEIMTSHAVGNWRARPNYLNQFQFIPGSNNAHQAVLNSCSQRDVPPSQQCSGRGYCRYFAGSAATEQANPITFCQCDRDWADPECSTRRKSQLTAFLLSLFLGFLGADYFYLGFPFWGLAKLLTLGGLGFWWLVDIIRIAAGPVYAYNFRTAHDLAHWVAMLIIFFAALLVGFCIAVEMYMSHRQKKRANLERLKHDEEESHWYHTKEDIMNQKFHQGFHSALAGELDTQELKHTTISDGRFRGYGSVIHGHIASGSTAHQSAARSPTTSAVPSAAFAL